MRKPRPEDFDPKQAKAISPKPEKVDLSGVVAIKARAKKGKQILSPSKKQPSRHEAIPPRHHDTTVSRYHDTVVELVRKAVKGFGKEAATHRFTKEEKQAIADIVYTYKKRGITTSENEITRIAINFILNDFAEYSEESILDSVLKALNK